LTEYGGECVISRMSEPKSNEASAHFGAPANEGDAKPVAPTEAAPEQLTKEEQWALFEKELKESDWGHQPC
jgi:hypothetical protein